MRGRILVHIGLPKTGTSSLQMDFFPRLNELNVEYVGVDGSRRGSDSSQFYWNFINSINTGSIKDLRKFLEESLAVDKVIVLSEEMLVVSEGGLTWQEKIKRLGEALAGFDYTILLSVREPASAMFSYYGELYRRFSKRYKNFLDCALVDNDMEIFHYAKLTNTLCQNFDKDRIFAFKFEDVLNNNLSRLLEVISPDSNGLKNLIVGHYNSRKNKAGRVETADVFKLSDIPRFLVRPMKLDNFDWFLKLKKALGPIIVFADRFVLHTKKIPNANPSDLIRIREVLVEDNRVLKNLFGIEY